MQTVRSFIDHTNTNLSLPKWNVHSYYFFKLTLLRPDTSIHPLSGWLGVKGLISQENYSFNLLSCLCYIVPSYVYNET